MGELVLSLRLPALNGASSFSVRKVLLEHSLGLPRRSRCAIAAEARNSGFSSNLEGNSDCRFPSSVDNHHPHHQNYPQHLHLHHYQHHAFHHHQLPNLWQGSLDVEWHSGRLGLGFSSAAESDFADTEKPEHGHCSNIFLYNTKCSSDVREDPIAVNYACVGGLIAAGVDLPLSLRMLKRKQQGFRKSTLPLGLSEVGNSLLNAFSSVVHMMKALQSHTLHIRRQFFAEEVEGLLSQVHREMHVSFVWLFQQIFSCTPGLMVLIMVFLADFTAFSMASNIPLLPISMYTPPVSIVSTLSNSVNSSDEGLRAYLNKAFEASPSVVDIADGTYSDGGYVGNGGRRIYHIKGGDDDDPDFFNVSMNLNKARYEVDDNLPTELSSKAAVLVSSLHKNSKSQAGLPPNDFDVSATEDLMASEFSDTTAALVFQELMTGEALLPTNSNDVAQYAEAVNDAVNGAEAVETKQVAGASSHLSLDQETMRSLVAPVSAKVEDDDYSCYDKTDLAYQVAINRDSKNPMLLANYAQFLFLVRKDHDRAEELFQKAVQCDPFDCDAISRFASFLWLARRNLVGAEKAYQAALLADPTNSFHAANYAHFLWNSGPQFFDGR